MQLSVIIVNYNVQYFLEQCLYAVAKACANIDAEIFVVDNNSTDDSQAYLTPRFPQVKFKWNSTNVGFGKANNSVLAEAMGDYVLFLNPDTIVAEDCFEKCLACFKQHQDCGALGVRMIDGSGTFLKESKRSFPSAMASFYKIIGLSKLFPTSKVFSAYYAGNLPEHTTNVVDVLSGAFMMVDKKMIAATNGFDEDFFMYAEDIDLSYRIQKEGKKNYYCAETTIIHFKGESTQKLTATYIRHFYDAMYLFVKKHYGQRAFLYFITSFAIAVNKGAALLKMYISKIISTSTQKIEPSETAVIADQQGFNDVVHLLKYAKQPYTIVGRIAKDKSDTEQHFGFVEEQINNFPTKKIKQIVFCGAAIDNKSSIHFMQHIPKGVSFLFHADKSESIVGSSKKNSKGVFIAKP